TAKGRQDWHEMWDAWSTMLITALLPLSVAVGGSKLQAVPSCTVLLVLAQLMTEAVVSTTVTVWLHCAVLPHASVATQVRVASKVVPQWPAVLVTVPTTLITALPLRSEERRVGKD